jgi:hypothetical protein
MSRPRSTNAFVDAGGWKRVAGAGGVNIRAG